MRTLSLITLSLAAASLGAQNITLAEGDTAQALTLRVLDEKNPSAPGRIVLSQVELLPIEISDRTAQQALRVDRARLVTRQGLTRVELPGGRRIIRYRRANGKHYGFLLILANGLPVGVLELPGTGLSGTVDPFADRIGVAGDGRHAAIVTKAGALHVARLDGLNYRSSGSPSRPIKSASAVDVMSLAIGRSMLFFQTENQKLWRCPLADLGVPQDVTPTSTAATILKEQMAMSGDGKSVVFLHGLVKKLDLYVLRETGVASKLPIPASKYEEPGFLPETKDGPFLLLSHDGSRLLYKDTSLRDEYFLADIGKSPVAITHVTGNSNFAPYIGTGILPIFLANTLLISVGNPAALDLFAATTESPLVTNLSRTNGNLKAPFKTGSLQARNAVPTGAGTAWFLEGTASDPLRLRLVSLPTASSMVMIHGMRGPLEAGSSVNGPVNYLVPGMGGDFILAPSAALILATPRGFQLSPDVQAGGGAFSFFSVRVAGFWIPVLRLPNGLLFPLLAEANPVHPILTPQGGAILHGRSLLYLSLTHTAVVARSKKLRFVLSGAGA